MRVAMFSWESLHSFNLGGLAVHVTELAAGLQRRGHEIHVITRRRGDQGYYDCIHGVHYHRVDHGVSQNIVESMDWMCKAMAHRFHEVTSFVGPFDLIHAHDWMAGNVIKYVRDGHGTRGLLTLHSTQYGRDGNVFHDGYARWVRDTEAAACFHARSIIAVSNFLAAEVSRIYQVPHWKLHVVPNGVNYHAFDGFIDPGQVKARYHVAPMAPTVLTVARMTAQKGIDMLVDAVPMVLASYPETKFFISGDGPELDAVVRRAHAIGAAHAIRFLGPLARNDYADLTRAVDVVAVPSRNEPFGIVVLEAWAAGKPVVATTAGGPRDFVWHNVNGFLVDANPGGLAHGIGSLLADHEHCRRLGQAGRRAVEEHFNWDNIAGFTEGVYQAVVR